MIHTFILAVIPLLKMLGKEQIQLNLHLQLIYQVLQILNILRLQALQMLTLQELLMIILLQETVVRIHLMAEKGMIH